MHRYLVILLFLLAGMAGFAQERRVSGTLLDKETKEAVIQATIQLLKAKDSTYVAGAITDEDGNFALKAPENGKYIVKMSVVGYKTVMRNVTISEDQDFAFGKVNLETDAVLLKEVIANGVATKVVIKEDTFIYNAAAYRTPEGSVVEELVKRLPGAQIDDSGKITINGKEVKKIKVDGKEFMTGDTQTALKNLPTAIVEKVKAYDEKSDLARMTGVDDGEETTILDFGIKRGMNKGYLTNIDLAMGTQKRYAERVMGGYMADNNRVMVMGNANNNGDRGFGRGGGGGGSGLRASKMLGLNYNYEKKNKFKADFSLRWNHGGNDNFTKSETESFVRRQGAFSNSISQNYGRNNSWNMSANLEWKPDTMTTIQVRPSFNTSSNDSRGMNSNWSYNNLPDGFDDVNVFDLEAIKYIHHNIMADSLLVNSTIGRNLSYSTNTDFNIQGTVNRRLSSRGNNLTWQGRYGTGNSDSESLSNQQVDYYQIKTREGNDSVYYRNRYNVTPQKNWNFQTSLSYTERLSKFSFLVMRYMYRYTNRSTERSTYDFSQYSDFGKGLTPIYRDFRSYLYPFTDEIGVPLSDYYDKDQSRYTQYDNYVHEMEVTWRRTTNTYNLNLGVLYQPQSQTLTYHYLKIDTIAKRSVSNITPTLDFRYRWTKQKSIRLNYRGNSSQPSMESMLPITDDTNPLNITKGNPGLKPSFTQNASVRYNNYIQKRFSSVMAFLNYSNTRNSISNMVTYDDKTGGRTTQPMNINGNWNMSTALMYNTAVDTLGKWNINTFTQVNYNNHVNYVNLQRNAIVEKNYTRSTRLNERLGMSYRNSWLEVELNGNVTYSINRNKLQPNNNMNTWDFNYGTDITITAPWGMGISTSAHVSSRRGYATSEANTDEIIWNAQISQSFLTGKPLTVMLQFYDILNERSSFSRSIDANSRRDTWSNHISQYAMLHVIFRFNAFGGKAGREARQAARQGREGGEPGERYEERGGDRGRGNGGRPGGMSGGMPMRGMM